MVSLCNKVKQRWLKCRDGYRKTAEDSDAFFAMWNRPRQVGTTADVRLTILLPRHVERQVTIPLSRNKSELYKQSICWTQETLARSA
jgi:hypothetical protein